MRQYVSRGKDYTRATHPLDKHFLIMMHITKKDLPDLWCMVLAKLGGRARRIEISDWIEERKKLELITFSKDINSMWSYYLGTAGKTPLQNEGVIKSEKIGSKYYWSFVG